MPRAIRSPGAGGLVGALLTLAVAALLLVATASAALAGLTATAAD